MAKKTYPKPTKEDWILLRLLKVGLDTAPQNRLVTSPDFVKAILYLDKKVGTKQFYAMCDALNKEKRSK